MSAADTAGWPTGPASESSSPSKPTVKRKKSLPRLFSMHRKSGRSKSRPTSPTEEALPTGFLPTSTLPTTVQIPPTPQPHQQTHSSIDAQDPNQLVAEDTFAKEKMMSWRVSDSTQGHHSNDSANASRRASRVSTKIYNFSRHPRDRSLTDASYSGTDTSHSSWNSFDPASEQHLPPPPTTQPEHNNTLNHKLSAGELQPHRRTEPRSSPPQEFTHPEYRNIQRKQSLGGWVPDRRSLRYQTSHGDLGRFSEREDSLHALGSPTRPRTATNDNPRMGRNWDDFEFVPPLPTQLPLGTPTPVQKQNPQGQVAVNDFSQIATGDYFAARPPPRNASLESENARQSPKTANFSQSARTSPQTANFDHRARNSPQKSYFDGQARRSPLKTAHDASRSPFSQSPANSQDEFKSQSPQTDNTHESEQSVWSSRLESQSTTHSSVFTKNSALSDEDDLAGEDSDGEYGKDALTVDEVFDMYCQGFDDEPGTPLALPEPRWIPAREEKKEVEPLVEEVEEEEEQVVEEPPPKKSSMTSVKVSQPVVEAVFEIPNTMTASPKEPEHTEPFPLVDKVSKSKMFELPVSKFDFDSTPGSSKATTPRPEPPRAISLWDEPHSAKTLHYPTNSMHSSNYSGSEKRDSARTAVASETWNERHNSFAPSSKARSSHNSFAPSSKARSSQSSVMTTFPGMHSPNGSSVPSLPSNPHTRNTSYIPKSLRKENHPTSAAIFGGDMFKDNTPKPPGIQEPTELHDQYGFKKETREITVAEHNAWVRDYTRSQTRRSEKWVALLRDAGLPTKDPERFPARSAKIQRFIRKGVPPHWRGAVWFHYAGGAEVMQAHPGLYDELSAAAGGERLGRADREAIERDLHRTFPDNVHFRPADRVGREGPETELVLALRRVLGAFAIHHPRIGYCQSLNFLAGLLLLFMTEEKAFWMLHIITSRLLPGTHEVSLEGANVDLWVLMVAVRDNLPSIWAKVGDGPAEEQDQEIGRLPPVSLCCTSWFMSLFIGTLPIETVLRVWDVMFYEGVQAIFRTALAVFRLGEPDVRAISDPMEIFQVVQSFPRRILDAGTLISTACQRGAVSAAWVEKRRRERKAWYAGERAAADKGRRDSQGGGAPRNNSDGTEQKTAEKQAKEAAPHPRRDLKRSKSTIFSGKRSGTIKSIKSSTGLKRKKTVI